ncbi:lipase (class 2) [Prauserella shujinwangii]|uniref:Lipase (Class 2) n=1 Tax=Prauserella shujinwangii TaxID=1453103 RepID=A0A2T0LPW7_9PSEU|nr:alpha/beta fold hydrolase [Prauserella shujinwangii]PRX45385.1 lipase (class 2) [Prauserella shujinwangii]
MKRVVRRWFVAGLALMFALVPTVATAEKPVPVVYSGVAALANGALRPDTEPAGANDWTCRPSPAHPDPVVLVHGTIENKTYNWYTLAPLLKNEGYCVFALNYGRVGGPHVGLPGSAHTYGAGPVAESAVELGAFVDRVLAATGASEVDIVGHSQGGMMPRYYLRFLGGAAKVDTLVGLAPSNHGTTVNGLAKLPGVPYLLTTGLGPAVEDQIAGSEFLTKLNRGGDTVPGVRYTVIQTRYDEVVTPYTSAFLEGPNVTNILLQDRCPANASDHLGISFDAAALRHVRNALDPAHAEPPRCALTLPVNGGGAALGK